MRMNTDARTISHRQRWIRAVLACAFCILLLTGSPGRAERTRSVSLQTIAEQAIGKADACVVALDPRDGRVLALVNRRIARGEAFPPGSVAKLVVAFAGLREGLVDRGTVIECRNVHKCGSRTLICSRPGGHGRVGLEQALAESCSVFFYRLGERLGADRLIRYYRRFGLGYGLGKLPSQLANQFELDQASVGMHQAMRVTPLAMAVMTAAMANGGTLYRPSIGAGDRLAVSRRIDARPGSFERVRAGMRRAVVDGTARRASVPGLDVCGKTGSPEVPSNPKYRHAWFAGFAPYDRPRIVVVVFARWGHGGDAAAPIARRVFAGWRDYGP